MCNITAVNELVDCKYTTIFRIRNTSSHFFYFEGRVFITLSTFRFASLQRYADSLESYVLRYARGRPRIYAATNFTKKLVQPNDHFFSFFSIIS